MDSMIGDDDNIGDLIGDEILGDEEIGRRVRRLARLAKRHGMQLTSAAEVRKQARLAAMEKASVTGYPQTIGNKLAASGQRVEVATLGSVSLAAAAGSLATLSATLQRGFQASRLIIQAADATDGTDLLASVGISNAAFGAHNLFATPNVVGPATAFGRDAWGTDLMTEPLGQGGAVSLSLVRLAATTNASVVTAMLVGYSAG